MTSIMQSIKPQYCELIAAGRKTYELRKTRPKIETPFKVYIYCTKDGFYGLQSKTNPALETNASGKVIGEYICDEIKRSDPAGAVYYISFDDNEALCLKYDEICKYGNRKPLYLWHISNLKIYDEPKALSKFSIIDNDAVKNCIYRRRVYNNPDYTNGALLLGGYACDKGVQTEWCDKCLTKPLTCPPQSWCYCEEV